MIIVVRSITNINAVVILGCLIPVIGVLGCGYTLLRDVDEEEKQAEYRAIDSLSLAPDLTISGVKYTYIPSPPRRDALDIVVHPAMIRFHITISNVGTTDLSNPFLIMYEFENRDYRGVASYSSRGCNESRDTIQVNETIEIEIEDLYPYYGSPYRFTIITNPVIQRELLEALQSQHNNRITVVKSREWDYDNNDFLITVASLRR